MDQQAFASTALSSTTPRIAYFISRTNGSLVPLVPADELPYSIRLQGLPRILRADQTYGMQQVGVLSYTGNLFKLEHEIPMVRSTSQPQSPTIGRNHTSSPSNQFMPPDALVRQAAANSAGAGVTTEQYTMPKRPMSAHELATTNWRKTPTSATSDKTQEMIDAITGITHGPNGTSKAIVLPPSGQIPDQEKKQYCSFWIRYGECDYTQQGCRYKHEMPDADTLKAIGVRNTPRWWIEKNQKVRLGGGGKDGLSSGVRAMPSWWPGQGGSLALKKSTCNHSDADESESASNYSGSQQAVTGVKENIVVAKDGTTVKENANSVPSTTPVAAPTPAPALTKTEPISESFNLIDLDEPTTLPATTLPATTLPATTPPVTASSAPSCGRWRVITNTETAPNNTRSTTTAIKPTQVEQVFVPAGESPAHHIAQVKQRAERAQRRPRAIHAPSLDKQIQSMQKGKFGGMMASKHATLKAAGTAPKEEVHPMGCRRVPRRDHAVPTRSPAAAPATAPAKEAKNGKDIKVVVTEMVKKEK